MTRVTRITLVVVLLALFALALRYIPFVLPSYGLYASAIVAAIALVCLAHPMPVFWMASRSAAAIVLGVSLAAAVTTLCWPLTRQHTTSSDTLIDTVLPEYDVVERHAVTLAAPPDLVWQTLHAVTFDDVPVFAAFMRIRLAAVGRFAVDAPPPARPILAAMIAPGSGFTVVASQPGHEIVLAMVGRPWDNRTPVGSAPDLDAFGRYVTAASVRIAFNFRVAAVAGGTRLTTETRVAGTDPEGTRIFGRYWRVVYPGSAVLRQAWLDAVVRRLGAVAT